MAKSKFTSPKNDLALNIEARGHRETLLLWPKLWQRWNPSVRLRWTGKRFSSRSRNSIPNSPGVYAFVIQPGVPAGIPHAIIMYVGMSDRPLRERFGEYLRERGDPTGRPAVSTMLQMYAGYLHFYCAPVTGRAKPKDVEDHLLEILAPPMNKQYPATIRRITGAF
jgi:hypothetical protein